MAFYGSDNAALKGIHPLSPEWGVKDPAELYDVLCGIWCPETCAPRLRKDWSVENRTLGQCSVTAFLVQDIFGGQVFGIEQPGGNFHCYNSVDGVIFDLTSEQFGGRPLSYENNPLQSREAHFAKEEKQLRYELLKKKLKERGNQNGSDRA